MSYWERCPECKALGKIDEEQFLGKVSIECSECGHHYHRERGVFKLRKIRIKYLRNRGRRSEDTFWSEREVGQVIEDTAMKGIIDEVLEIEGVRFAVSDKKNMWKDLKEAVEVNPEFWGCYFPGLIKKEEK